MIKVNKNIETKTLVYKKEERMKRKKQKRLSLIMAVMLIIVSFAGCGDKKEEAKATVAQETTSASESEGNGFDFSQVFDNIEIDGKRIPFPFTLNELGDDFDIDMIVELGDGTCGASLMYKNEMIASIDCVGNKKSDINRDTVIYGISLMNRSAYEKVYINGINCKSSLEDVRQNFKGLTENVDENGRIVGSKASDGENYILIAYEDNFSIRGIYVDGPKE